MTRKQHGRHPRAARRPRRPGTANGRSVGGFDFTFAVRTLSEDITRRVDDLAHIDMDRVAVSFTQTRKAVSHGMHACLIPLRFADGALTTQRQGRLWRVQRLLNGSGEEMLYVLNFYVPRFLNQAFMHKLETIVHELVHVSPRFDGDLRRFAGRCYAHGASKKSYDAYVSQLAHAYLATRPDPRLVAFLQCNFQELTTKYGQVIGTRIPHPKLVPLPPAPDV